MTEPTTDECTCDHCEKCETLLLCDGCLADEQAKSRAAEAKLAQAFTLEDLEAQVARTQGRGKRDCFIKQELLVSLTEEAQEARAAARLWNFAMFRDAAREAEAREALKLELGDVLNVVTAIAMHAGFTLREVAEANDQKMRARMPEGVEQC